VIISIIIAMTTQSWATSARDALRRSGARSGSAREAVIDYLDGQRCCLSAPEVLDGLRAEGRSVGIASVYRALDQLAELGLVRRIDLGEGVTRFEPAHLDGEHHHHLVCGSCGKVDTFDDPALERAITQVAGSHGYALGEHEVVLHGACGDCRE
jgi:Fur family transcriptional regulator, ferric uptake regulator